MLSPDRWAKKNCPNKKFEELDKCIEIKCPNLVFRDGKPYGCKTWMEYFEAGHKS